MAPTHRFWVEIDQIAIATFSECSPVTMEVETMDYVEGGQNGFVHKLPVRAKYGNITLKRGIDMTTDLYEWAKEVKTGAPPKRRNVTITVYGVETDQVMRKYHLKGAYPVRWSGAEMRAESNAAAVETLEFAFQEVISVDKG